MMSGKPSDWFVKPKPPMRRVFGRWNPPCHRGQQVALLIDLTNLALLFA